MNLSALSLRSCVFLFVALMSIASVATAKEPSVVTARKAVVSTSPSKSPVGNPWWISLTIREGQPTTEPIAGLSLSNGDTGLFLASGAKPALFSANPHPSSLSRHSAANPPLPTLAPHQGFAGVPRQGFTENTPVSGILDSLPHQPMIAGDTSGNGTINFVDISAAMQLGNPSVAPQLGGVAK